VRLQTFGKLLKANANKIGHMPDTNDWCYSLIGSSLESTPLAFDSVVTKRTFSLNSACQNCNFAYNKNLGYLPIEGLSGNTVLLFEGEGDFNLSGDEELLSKELKDNQWAFYNIRKKNYRYIIFIDGTMGKYRLSDGAIAFYDPNIGYKRSYEFRNFTKYCKKGKTPYSPLKWR
jgi:hypothetical protein